MPLVIRQCFFPLVAELDLKAGIAYDVILDMDLEKSIPPENLHLPINFH